MKVNFKNVDQYIISFPKEVQGSLKNIRAIVKTVYPNQWNLCHMACLPTN
jgi:hypothetical protein